MTICSNCYTGCTNIITDKCVKYTGVANETLGIQNGDSINYVTSTLMCWVTANANGTGIKYELAAEDMCTITTQYLTDCTDITVIDITRALSKAICDLDTTTTTLVEDWAALEAVYTIPACITVDADAGTHAILQAALTEICVNADAITATNLDLTTNYVAIADIDTYIADWVAANIDAGGTGFATKMVPFTVVEYYGSLTFFDATGAGTGDWVNIYLCNGNNGTPDKRGRVPIGTTSGMGGGAFNPAVDPGISGNPTYSLYSVGGANTITLTAAQLPSHTHTGTTSTDGSHTHTYTQYTLDQEVATTGSGVRSLDNADTQSGAFVTSSAGLHSHTFTTSASGGGDSHSNIQPVLACHYIMYIPV